MIIKCNSKEWESLEIVLKAQGWSYKILSPRNGYMEIQVNITTKFDYVYKLVTMCLHSNCADCRYKELPNCRDIILTKVKEWLDATNPNIE